MKKMMILLFFFVKNNYGIILAVLLFGLITRFLTTKLRKPSDAIPGWLGFPLIGETFSLLSAANSSKGCYDFVRSRRSWYGKWFKTRLFGKIHVFVPSVVGAKTIFSNEFRLFDKCLVKSMADAVGKKSLLCVPVESHKRIRRLLSGPFSTDSLSKFVHKFDKLVSERFKKLAENGNSFVVLDFTMKIQFEAMCDMLMSITDESLLNEIEKDCTAVSDSMLSFPDMIPGSRYYKGIKEEQLSILENKPKGDFLCLEDLNKMSYGSKVVKETLRMSNVLLWFPRVVLADCKIQEFEIKKGWHVNIDATHIHYDPELYKDPLHFNPSRFEEIPKPYSYLPFGSGPRVCLGINMAKLTMLVFLHRLTSGYK